MLPVFFCFVGISHRKASPLYPPKARRRRGPRLPSPWGRGREWSFRLTAALYYNDCPDDPERLRLPWNTDLEGHSEPVRSVAFSPDGKWVATGSNDNTAKIRNAETGETTMTLEGHSHHISAIAFSPDGAWLATGSEDNKAKIWDLKTGEVAMILEGHKESIISIAFSLDGKNLVTGAGDNTLKIWDLSTGQHTTLPGGHNGDVLALAFSSDGQKLATGSNDGTAKIWDLPTKQPPTTLRGHGNYVSSVAFSPDGKWLATGAEDKIALIWEVETGKQAMKLAGHHDKIWSLAFSPDGKKLVTGSWDGTAKIWDLKSGKIVQALQHPDCGVQSIAFSPDGQRLVTGGDDWRVKIWDLKTGEVQLALEGHTGAVNSVAFSSDGKRVATASADSTAKIWELDAEAIVRQLHSKRRLAAITRLQLEDWDLDGLLDIKPDNEALLRNTEAADQVVAFADLCAKNVRNPESLARAMRLYESASSNGSPAIRELVAQHYSDLGKAQLYLPDGQAAEATLRRGIALDAANPHLPRHLAPALLLQGRYADAEKIYLENRDKSYDEGTYRDAFLHDLKTLEDQGVAHPDIARIRARLKEGQ